MQVKSKLINLSETKKVIALTSMFDADAKENKYDLDRNSHQPQNKALHDNVA